MGYWGLDLGGTKIEGVVLPTTGEAEAICRIRLPTQADQGYEHIVDQIGRLLEQMAQAVGQRPEVVGIGTPGVLDPSTQTMKNCNTTCLNGRPLKADLQRALGLPVEMANDANCFALAEARLGAGRGAETVFGIIMGTGVGGGVVVGGKVLDGCQGIAGEWGHNILVPAGLDCYCGRRGCVETVLSGPALEAHYAAGAGRKRPLAEIAALVAEDSQAQATMDHLVQHFGLALASLVNILDPHVIVLGGGVSNVELLYTAGVQALEGQIFNNRLETRILKHQLGDSAGVFGAAMLVA